MSRFPDNIKSFIDKAIWTFAKTMPEWPHEYVVRKNVDDGLFVQTVEHIRKYGYQGWFYNKQITYFEEDGLVYWTMGSPIDETTIINRTKVENSYEERLKKGTMPKRRSCSQ